MSCFNSSSFIIKSINSALNQTYDNIEVIIVDDCSTDNTIEVIKSINDERIKLIKQDENKGAGIARKTGIKYSTGDYTMFLDSDDYIDNNHIQNLINVALEYNADIVASGIIAEENNKTIFTHIPKFNVYNNGINAINNLDSYTKKFLTTTIIKSTLWQKVTYSERRYIEDTQTYLKLLYFANKVIVINKATYHYIQRNDSLIHTTSKIKNSIYRLLMSKDIYEFSKDKGNFESPENACYLKLKELLDENYSLEEYLKYPNECAEILHFISQLNIT